MEIDAHLKPGQSVSQFKSSFFDSLCTLFIITSFVVLLIISLDLPVFGLSFLIDLNNDVLLAKRANYERVKEFSKQLKDFNRSSLQEQRKLPYSSEVVGIDTFLLLVCLPVLGTLAHLHFFSIHLCLS